MTRYDSVMLTMVTAAVRTTSVRAFAASTGRRVGTVAHVERTMPVEYSRVTNRAPMTAMISIPIKEAARDDLGDVHLLDACGHHSGVGIRQPAVPASATDADPSQCRCPPRRSSRQRGMRASRA